MTKNYFITPRKKRKRRRRHGMPTPPSTIRSTHEIPGLFSTPAHMANAAVSLGTGIDLGYGGVTPVHRHHERTWTEFGTEVGSTLAGAALGFITGDVPGAIIGGYYGNRAAQIRNTEDVVNVFDQTKTSIGALMSGAGYLGKATILRKEVNTLKDKYQARGAVVLHETFGKVEDPDCIGVGHTTFRVESVCKAIGLALLRKLYNKASVIIDTTENVVPVVSFNQSGVGTTLVWQLSSPNGTNTFGSYAIPPNFSLNGILTGSGLQNQIYDMITDENSLKIERIALEYNDTSIPQYVIAQINLKQEIVDIVCSVHTIIQNRTKTATGTGSTNIDQIDVQPLKGPVFEFNGVPKTKQNNNVTYNTSYIGGVVLVKAANATTPGAWKEPPAKKSFSNVTKSGYTRLNPGAMKDMAVTDKYRGYFQNIVGGRFKFTTQGVGSSTDTVAFAPGRTQIAFLEEELNSGSSNNIHIQYETQHTICCQFITSSYPNMMPHYGVSADINLV